MGASLPRLTRVWAMPNNIACNSWYSSSRDPVTASVGIQKHVIEAENGIADGTHMFYYRDRPGKDDSLLQIPIDSPEPCAGRRAKLRKS